MRLSSQYPNSKSSSLDLNIYSTHSCIESIKKLSYFNNRINSGMNFSLMLNEMSLLIAIPSPSKGIGFDGCIVNVFLCSLLDFVFFYGRMNYWNFQGSQCRALFPLKKIMIFHFSS